MTLFGRRWLRLEGERAVAVVLSCESRDGRSDDDLRDYEYLLRVRTADAEVFETTVCDRFWPVDPKPRPGDAGVPVRFDPISRETVLDLERDSRFSRP
jgi:hypothetical protein